MRTVKNLVYPWIRPLVVKDVDRNEDYKCMYCSEPVLRRVLFCSDTCSKYFDMHVEDLSEKDRRIEALSKQLELVKKESGITTLIRHIDKLTKENDSLAQEVAILRCGCDRVKILDNPAMRWVHRALRDADAIRGKREPKKVHPRDHRDGQGLEKV